MQLEQKLLLLHEIQLFTLHCTVKGVHVPLIEVSKPEVQLEQKLLLLQERQLVTLH